MPLGAIIYIIVFIICFTCLMIWLKHKAYQEELNRKINKIIDTIQ